MKSGLVIWVLVFLALVIITGGGNGTMAVSLLIIGLSIVIAVVIKSLLNSLDNARRQQENDARLELVSQRSATLREAIASAETGELDFGKIVRTRDNTACLGIDNKNKCILIVENGREHGTVLPFERLVSYNLDKDGMTYYDEDITPMLVGSILLGTKGAIIGAAAAPRTEEHYCRDLCISIVDDEAERYKISLLEEPADESGYTFRSAMDDAKDMLAILDAAKHGAS